MHNNKSHRNDSLPKEFYEIFWDSLDELLLNSIHTSFLKEELSSSQKQTENIEFIEKKDKD